MNHLTKSKPLAITQAKLIRKDGTIKYYFSKPTVRLLDINGRLWVWRRIKAMKKERTQ